MKNKMIEINLLPKELRKAKKVSLELEKGPMVRVAVTILLLIAGFHFLVVFLAGQNRAESEVLTAEWNRMEPEREKTGMLTKDALEIEKRLDAIRSITDNKFDWTKLLNSLNNAVIPKIWLSELELKFEVLEKKGKGKISKKEPASISITGHALGSSQEATSSVAKFITSLKENKDFADCFSEVELQNMRTREIAGEETMRFILNCRLRSATDAEGKTGSGGRR
ncbi:MAG: hypothetical protein ABH862_05105 [Candidatus Omnitrophota bacterium]